jgi:hypothetical protein
MGIALAILIPILLLVVIALSFWFHFVKQKMTHERHMLALQKGLPVPLEPTSAGPRSAALGLIALLVPPICALIALGITIWAWNQPWPDSGKWNVTGIAFIAAGWTACIIVSVTAVIVTVNSEIEAARQNTPADPVVPVPRIPSGLPEGHNP